MNSYRPPFEITNTILLYVSSISEKITKITASENLDTHPHLRRNNRIHSIHSSLKIEANSLSFGQVKDVIEGKIVLGDRNEIQEVKNANEAYTRLSEINPFSTKDLRKFHGIMTQGLVRESGKFRSSEEGVFRGNQCIFMAPPAHFVPTLIDQLFSWMRESQNKVHPLIMSSVFHYEFIFIHPFTDGNGRMARLWQTAILAKWKSAFEYIPVESQIEKFQEEYYRVISQCHTEGSSTAFIEFMLRQTDSILNEIISPASGNNEDTQLVNKLLAVMEREKAYTTNELLEKLKMKSRASFRKNYLVPAMEAGLVEMTIPDKPNSRNQKYRKR